MKTVSIILLLALLILSSPVSASESRNSNPKHGDKQVEKMLSDRPAMKEFITFNGALKKMSASDLVWKWAAQAYENKVLSCNIEWDNSEVSKPIQYLAEHVMPYNGSNGLIRIREVYRDSRGKTRKATFEELWFACICELINIQNDEAFFNIYHQALRADITREKWIRMNTELEHQALLQCKVFFQEVWIPWAERNTFKYDQQHWRVDTPEDYQEWVAQYQKSKNNPYEYWGNYYDTKITPYLDEVMKYKKYIGSNNPMQNMGTNAPSSDF